MSKGSGGTRLIGPKVADTRESYKQYQIETNSMRIIGGSKWNFFDFDSGGFLLTEKGHHIGNENETELEFASILARNGYQVTLTNETDGVSFRLTKYGDKTFPDGKVYDVYFEQSTPTTPKNNKIGYRQALIHASDKGVPIAAVYDKFGVLHREDIDNGIESYEQLRKTNPLKYREIKGVLVINSRREIYSHWK